MDGWRVFGSEKGMGKRIMGHGKLILTDPSVDYPEFLSAIVKKEYTESSTTTAPIVFDMNTSGAAESMRQFLKAYPQGLEVVDNYAEQYAELLLSKNAHLYRANLSVQQASIQPLLEKHYGGKEPWTLGSWVYYPWNRRLIHVLAQDDFETLRSIRNRDLITADEQLRLLNFSATCFGMSVGSAGALGLGISGISRSIKLVDGAVISGSNLNRILTGVASVGKSKSLVIGQQMYEMNPYSSIEYYNKVDASNIDDIFDARWSTGVAIDEIDDIEMKVRIRYEARKRRVPVVMATEIGDTVILDVERFDEEPNRPLFHGMLPNAEALLENELTDYREWTRHAVKIIDPTNMSIKMQESLLKIGTTIVTHPQLGSTVMMTGGVIAFAAKSIALGHPIKSGRYVISLERTLLADHQTRDYRRQHKKHTRVINTAVNAM